MPYNFEKFERLSVDEKSADTFQSEKTFNSELFKKQSEIRQNQKSKHLEIEHEEYLNTEKEVDNELNNLIEDRVTKDNVHEFLNKYFADNSRAEKIAKEKLIEDESFGVITVADKLKTQLLENLTESEKRTTEQEAETLHNQLKQEDKPNTEILKTLISTFENDESLSLWVENWQKFLELSEFAQTKPPGERQAIEKIVNKADFMDIDSFTTALQEIDQSSAISNATKLKIREKFGADDIQTISSMDARLKNIKSYKKDIEKDIKAKKAENESIEKEITDIEDKIKELDPADPKREELEKKLKTKKKQIKSNQTQMENLSNQKPEKVEFLLRPNISARLKDDGSREIRIIDENFVIKLPQNRLFNGTKNLRTINLAFSAIALRKVRMLSTIFAPNLKGGVVPNKQQRKLGHLILSELGFDDKRILPQHETDQLEKDISKLKKGVNYTGHESLAELGILDKTKDLNKMKFKKALRYIREKRGANMNFEQLKKFLNDRQTKAKH